MKAEEVGGSATNPGYLKGLTFDHIGWGVDGQRRSLGEHTSNEKSNRSNRKESELHYDCDERWGDK
jgi:hypothetical protein